MRLLLLVAVIVSTASGLAQDRLSKLIDITERTARKAELQKAMSIVRLQAQWVDGSTVAYQQEGAWYTVSSKTGEKTKHESSPLGNRPTQQRANDPNANRQRPARGRQYTEEYSPDGSMKVFYRDGNLFLANSDGTEERAVTTEGDVSKRIKYGSASWVYGEELGQRDAMGWSPDGKMVWYYRFDDSMVKDYFIAMSQTGIQTTLDVEAYPKAGTPNPECDVYIYHLDTGVKVKVKVREGEFDESVGHYVYSISWSPDRKELLFHRTNRWQNTMEFCAANPDTGEIRVVVSEFWPSGWTENRPARQYLDEHPDIEKAPQYRGKMIWRSARNGYENYYLVNMDTGERKAITNNQQDAGQILRVDVEKGEMLYMAAGAYNPYKMQLRRAKLDGSLDELLTDPNFHHTVSLSPDGTTFVDTEETVQTPPKTTLRSLTGSMPRVLAESNIDQAVNKGFKPTQRVIFKAADGVTDLYGTLQFPADFNPNKQYPVIVNIYAGPESNGHSESYQMFDRKTDYGFIIARFAVRGNSGRGKAFMDAAYQKLGVTEIDDHAEAIKAIGKLPFIDSSRVGITGSSYGGYSSTMCLLRYPDLFHAAVASSSVTKWHHYDTIYTERYMRTPQINPDGYENGSAMKYAKDLKGWLMLFYGTSDNNVHQSNTHELIQALQRAGKYFEVQVGPDQGHTGLNFDRAMEFFVERLMLTAPR